MDWYEKHGLLTLIRPLPRQSFAAGRRWPSSSPPPPPRRTGRRRPPPCPSRRLIPPRSRWAPAGPRWRRLARALGRRGLRRRTGRSRGGRRKGERSGGRRRTRTTRPRSSQSSGMYWISSYFCACFYSRDTYGDCSGILFKKAFLVYLPSVGRRRRGRECGGGPSADAARRRRIGQRKVEVHIARSLEKELSSIRKKVLFFLCSIFFRISALGSSLFLSRKLAERGN